VLRAGEVRAQASGILQKQITIELKGQSLKAALEILSEKASCTFSYSDDVIPVQKPVYIKAKNQALEEILDQLLEGTSIRFIPDGNNIILFRRDFLPEKDKKYTLSGYVTEKGSGEALLGVNVYIASLKLGTVTNNYGFYSLTVPSDSVELVFSYIGYRKLSRRLELYRDIRLNVSLELAAELGEVVVEADRSGMDPADPLMSRIDVPVQQIKDIPALLGEKDLLKVIQLMPGVQSGSEGQSGLYVRGGGPDQNLIILDDATVYNAFHLFGFLSLFNGDALRSVELTKGGFPARYGGRLSSVLDIHMKEGHKEEFHGEAGIGLVASRAVLEGPVKKNKSSFLISGRRTYLDALARPFFSNRQQAGYYFYDLTAKINYDFGDKDKIYLSTYFGKDRFFFKEAGSDYRLSGGLEWGNFTSTLRWNHLFSNKLFSNTSFIFSDYTLGISAKNAFDNQEFAMNFGSGIRDYSVKTNLDYLPFSNHHIKAGFVATLHQFVPKAVVVKDDFSGSSRSLEEKYEAVENGFYIEDNMSFGKRWHINAGIRISHFLAEKKNYIRPEPRLSASYLLDNQTSVKASFSVMNQYIHLLSSTGVGLPTDLWVPSTKKTAPQHSRQVALGFVRQIKKQLALTLEGYYKNSDGVIAYKEGASFLAIDDPSNAERTSWENNITSGSSLSYGMEILLRKNMGKFSGWAGYTLSKTTLRFDELNNGKAFFARNDRRHDVSLVGIYKISERIKLSATWVYGTGNAITLPLAEYFAVPHNPDGINQGNAWANGLFTSEYGEKNQFRMRAYHRLDISVQFFRKYKRLETNFELGLYNAYNRKNPFFYYIGMDNAGTERKLRQVSLFPVIPSVSYHVKF
jgi:hypothetical protein